MAAKDKDENQEQEPTPAPASGKKGLFITIGVAVLAVVLSVVATIVFLTGDEAADAEAPPAESVEQGAAAGAVVTPTSGPAVYLELNPPFQVGFDVNGRQRFMQVFISAQARTQDAIAAMEFHMPTIRSRLLSAYSSQEFATLQTEAGKLALLETTLNIINGVLEQEKSPLIENVYFTNFVLQ